MREHLQDLADRGRVNAREQLAPRPFPYSVSYLRDYAREIHGRSGIGEHGFAPATFEAIWRWSQFRGVRLAWHEVEALMRIDSAMLFPGEPEQE